MSQANLVYVANKAQAKTRIYGNIYLDKCCPKEKRLLKMNINSQNNQAKKLKTTALQAKANFPQSDQLKASNKAKKDGKKKQQKEKQKRKNPTWKAIPRLQGSMPLLVKKKSLAKIKGKIELSKTSPRSPIRTAIRKAIIPPIIPNLLK